MKKKKEQEQKTPLTRGEFENLLTRAAQPRELKRSPDSKEKGKSAESPSDDCSDSHTHQDNEQGT